ncbi:ImmA/IrrE family metallo-endopeptidase [Nocardia sp. NBC_01327]|uniref:ImmA/IrrE family metallo-endopeptidase n=1 Tax=Nocardia sp. NBC_01327 TaxID=2903593 RepID=UPI002E101A55|nr:ImmA/IrrE family metallo-endopeptidase [Nocardia sp. NBC_01327]
MTESRAHSIGSYRRVAAAVDAVCAVAADFDATSLDEVVLAISAERRRMIEIASAQLGPGVCGQRRSYPDKDVIVLAAALPSRDHTLAHELGHIVFDHPGEAATEVVLEASDDLIAYMLSQRAHQAVDLGEDEQCEWEAETFASMLMTRLRVFNNRGAGVSVLRFDEALG